MKLLTHRIQASCLNWRAATVVIFDMMFSSNLKGKFYRFAIMTILMWGQNVGP